jgi:hypothetical protein
MKDQIRISLILVFISFISGLGYAQENGIKWEIHDTKRPYPKKINPFPIPSDAIVLFSGADLSAWEKADKAASFNWKIEDGYFYNPGGKGDIQTRQSFGNCQIHIEWSVPEYDPGKSHYDRGNSGIYLMSTYELQIFDSYPDANIYADGMAASIYGQYPPLVNASLPPLAWQSFDIVFLRPEFDNKGKLLSPAKMTVFHNGVIVHHDRALTGPTAHKQRPRYEAHANRLPLLIQGHGSPVRFRNIWIREIE